MLEFKNNPLEDIVNIFQSKYPDKHAEIYFTSDFKKQYVMGHGFTLFPDDGSIPEIVIDGELSFQVIIEILSHELAHLAVGTECSNDHGPEWESVFNWIHEEYLKKINFPKEPA